MNKRDLVKWLEKEKTAALEQAKATKFDIINRALDREYESIGLDSFLDALQASFKSMVDAFDDLKRRCRSCSDTDNNIHVSDYYYKLSYVEFTKYTQDRDYLAKYVKEMIGIDTEAYGEAKREAIKFYNNVEMTYDNVIQTVKNLPTAKDGLEYLAKLGFDSSAIVPAQVKKQLPAVPSVNVDTRYLLIKNKEE